MTQNPADPQPPVPGGPQPPVPPSAPGDPGESQPVPQDPGGHADPTTGTDETGPALDSDLIDG
ncbi:MAG: hypothetical protein Q4G67_03515 [Actinomycetia bacterium]|nr:hypothetical protein [Actinomycetes bacterium]